MSTCDRLDLQTLGSQQVMQKNLPDHWSRGRTLGFLQYDWWKSTASQSSAKVWSAPKSQRGSNFVDVLKRRSEQQLLVNKQKLPNNTYSHFGWYLLRPKLITAAIRPVMWWHMAMPLSSRLNSPFPSLGAVVGCYASRLLCIVMS